jgi:hypothetical protein
MSDSSYKGDSPGKKVTRLRVWLNLRAMVKALHLPYTGTLVLAGEGGDLSVLKALGTDLATVVAIDHDSFLVEYCQSIYPEALSIVGEAGEMASVADYNVAHLDFCGGLRNPENIVTFAKVAHHAYSHPSLIACTMQKCREGLSGISGSNLLAGIPRPVQVALHAQSQAKGDIVGTHLFRGNRFDSRLVIAASETRLREMMPVNLEAVSREFFKPNGELGNLGHALIRAEGMRSCAEWLLTAWNFERAVPPVVLRLLGTYTYHSNTKTNEGQPYFTALYAVMPPSMEPQILSALSKMQLQRFDSWNKKTSFAGLQPTALELLQHIPVVKVAQMLDVPTVRIQTWKEQEQGRKADAPFSIQRHLTLPWDGLTSDG